MHLHQLSASITKKKKSRKITGRLSFEKNKWKLPKKKKISSMIIDDNDDENKKNGLQRKKLGQGLSTLVMIFFSTNSEFNKIHISKRLKFFFVFFFETIMSIQERVSFTCIQTHTHTPNRVTVFFHLFGFYPLLFWSYKKNLFQMLCCCCCCLKTFSLSFATTMYTHDSIQPLGFIMSFFFDSIDR